MKFGGKFECVIVSSKFEGKPLLQRHRLVNGILEEELKVIHAFSQKTESKIKSSNPSACNICSVIRRSHFSNLAASR